MRSHRTVETRPPRLPQVLPRVEKRVRTVAESKARFMREFSEENGSSLGLRDKKVRN